ncbi:MAG: hypothetical protein PHX18_04545 [Candidatus Gastranaerophilales bacterium]|nr:hypothetical protein [Candidatus Gastranaerophilales bacterium]
MSVPRIADVLVPYVAGEVTNEELAKKQAKEPNWLEKRWKDDKSIGTNTAVKAFVILSPDFWHNANKFACSPICSLSVLF